MSSISIYVFLEFVTHIISRNSCSCSDRKDKRDLGQMPASNKDHWSALGLSSVKQI